MLVHLPTHASWLNQIEIYFSILARKALTPCDFTTLDELAERVLGVQAESSKTATPPDWTFSRSDLHALLDRLDQRGRLTTAARPSFREPALARQAEWARILVRE